MQTTAIATLAFSAITLVTPTTAQPADKRVEIDSGTIEGAVSGGILSFKGIPYAAPPVGSLRWRSPQPVQRWTSVRLATQYGHDCMQIPDPSDAAPPWHNTSRRLSGRKCLVSGPNQCRREATCDGLDSWRCVC